MDSEAKDSGQKRHEPDQEPKRSSNCMRGHLSKQVTRELPRVCGIPPGPTQTLSPWEFPDPEYSVMRTVLGFDLGRVEGWGMGVSNIRGSSGVPTVTQWIKDPV